MEHTEEQKRRFKTTYAERRRRQLIVTVPVILMIFALAFTEDRSAGTLLGMRAEFVASIAFVAVIGALVFSFRNWRCPACNAYLGRSMNPRHCQNCGAALRD